MSKAETRLFDTLGYTAERRRSAAHGGKKETSGMRQNEGMRTEPSNVQHQRERGLSQRG